MHRTPKILLHAQTLCQFALLAVAKVAKSWPHNLTLDPPGSTLELKKPSRDKRSGLRVLVSLSPRARLISRGRSAVVAGGHRPAPPRAQCLSTTVQARSPNRSCEALRYGQLRCHRYVHRNLYCFSTPTHHLQFETEWSRFIVIQYCSL